MELDLTELRPAFFEEAAEHLTAMEEGLLELESSPDNRDVIDKIFRGAHSIKGGSGFVGFTEITRFTHDLENLLDQMRDGVIHTTADRVELLLRATDTLGRLLAASQSEDALPDEMEAVVTELQAQAGHRDEPPAPRAVEVVDEAPGEVQEAIVETQAAGNPPAVKESTAGTPRANPAESSIRVSVEKVDELINLVGELSIVQAMIDQAIRDLDLDRSPVLQEACQSLQRNTRELQERVMSVRMVPVGTVFRRFPRVVRDLATITGKQVNVEISGEETELDKQVIEQLSDPLTHLVRNAVDHGIEPPEERIAAGKPAQGRLRLSACHEGGTVVLDISEDGRGLREEKILAKAIEKGLVKADEQLTPEQIRGLIFLPGFSTAAAITDISGRGVGLDVVKRNIEGLNGSIRVETQPGKGTCFRIQLPLTLAILDGLSVRVGSEVYVLPMLSVIESFRPKPADVRRVLGRGELVAVRGENVPLIRLNDTFGIDGAQSDPCQALVVLVEHLNERYGLLVDDLLGQVQAVIKSLGDSIRKVPGVSGTTILGDGRVSLILDVPGLVRPA